MHGFLKFFAFNVVNFSRSVWIGISDELFGKKSNSEVELFGVISNSEVELFGKNDGQSGFIDSFVCNTGSFDLISAVGTGFISKLFAIGT